MLANSISGQLVAERQRALLHEAAAQGLARQARAPRHGPTALALRRTGTWLRLAAAVRIRPIRIDDQDLLSDGFSRLSPQSRRLRFFVSKKRLSAAELRYLTDVDHHNHEALVAVGRVGGPGLSAARFFPCPGGSDPAHLAG